MKTILRFARSFVEKGDMLLLFLCVLASGFGIVLIASATNYDGYRSYILVQIAALILGLGFYVIFTFLDIDIIAERRDLLFIFNLIFISLLFKWGVSDNTGNRSWLAFSWLPVSIQPAEVCKLTFIIIMARMMQNAGDRLSRPLSVGTMSMHLLITIGLIIVASSDWGSALVYVFLFIVMAYAGGVKLGWFLLGAGGLAAAAPFLWSRVLREDQKNRILVLFDPTIDPLGQKERWHTDLSITYLQSGGLTGDGLFQGDHTQNGSMPAQHTDFIFSVAGEELGMLGCIVVLLILIAIVIRIIYIGAKSQNYMNRLICIGIAAILLFQILIDVGMCIGVMPVIGLTLPFFSYGGSSLVTMFAAMGIVSGIKYRPAPSTNARYVTKQG